MPLKIYGVLRSRASRVIWAADEQGIAYEHVPVIQARQVADPVARNAPLNTASPEFLAINPKGKIPAIDDDGLLMHESLGVTLYLARKHGGPLAPNSLEEESLLGMWAPWAATACEPHTVQIIFHRVDYPEQKRDPAVVDAAITALRSLCPFWKLAWEKAEVSWSAGGSRWPTSTRQRCFAIRNPRPSYWSSFRP